MIRINLLDWRAERRDRRQKQFAFTTAAVAVASAAIVIAGLTLANSAVEYQKKRNDFLTAQITEIDAQIKEIEELEKVKADLIARMQVIQKLQRNRAEVVHYFDEMVNTLPDGTFLTSLSESNGKTRITGTAESNSRISQYMKNLESSDWFTNPSLVVIKVNQSEYMRLSNFEMDVKSSQPKKTASSEESSDETYDEVQE